MAPEDIPAPEDFQQLTKAEYDAINARTSEEFAVSAEGNTMSAMDLIRPAAVTSRTCTSWKQVKLAHHVYGEDPNLVRTRCYTGSGRVHIPAGIDQNGGPSVVWSGTNRTRIYYHEGGATPWLRWSGWFGPATTSANNKSVTARGKVQVIEMNTPAGCGPLINCPASDRPAM